MDGSDTPTPPGGLSRRAFVVVAGAAAAAACAGTLGGCTSGSGGAAGGDGSAAGLPPETNPNGTTDVGTTADYPHDGVYDRYAVGDRVYVVRRGGSLYALRSICTHQACLVKPLAGAEFACPCHGSRFEPDGTVTKGPAVRSLWRYAIAKSADGRLTVDKSRRFPADAKDPAAAVSVA